MATLENSAFPEGLAFDDVLLRPGHFSGHAGRGRRSARA